MLIKAIAQHLQSKGLGVYVETGYSDTNTIFLNHLPAQPKNVIAIYETGGDGNIIGFPDERRSVQIIVRNEIMANANSLIWNIYKSLINSDESGYLEISTRKLNVTSTNSPVSLGRDANNLFEYSVNFKIFTQYDI